MALWYALNDPLLQLEWTLDSLLQDEKLNANAKPEAKAKQPAPNGHTAPSTTQAQLPQSIKVSGPRWPAPAGQFDIIETPAAFELVTDAPGFDPADISVELKEGVLTISGTHKSHKEEQQPAQQEQPPTQSQEQQQGRGVKVWRRERRQFHFSRSFKLPDNTKADDIIARLDKGVLTVHVPKLPPAPKPQPQRITVQGAPAVAA